MCVSIWVISLDLSSSYLTFFLLCVNLLMSSQEVFFISDSKIFISQFSSITHSCPTLCNPTDYSTPGLSIHHQLPEFTQTHVHRDGPSNRLTLYCPLFLLPSVFPSIRVFSNESVLCIRWPKYWSFSFNISPSNEYSGLISFTIDWLISLQPKGFSRIFSNTTIQKHQFFVT